MNVEAIVAASRALQGALGLFYGDLAVVIAGERVEVLHPIPSLDSMKHGDQNPRAGQALSLLSAQVTPEQLVAAGDLLHGLSSKGTLIGSPIAGALETLRQHLASTQRSALPFSAVVASLPVEAACFLVTGGHPARTTIVIVEGGNSVMFDYAGDGP